MEDLNNILYEKMQSEQKEFLNELKNSTPEKIIENAYELVMREDILMVFENANFEPNKINELLKLEYPLAACYDSWLKADCSHMEMLEDTIYNFMSRMADKSKDTEKRAQKKKHEPER